jgi:hypothetical protein
MLRNAVGDSGRGEILLSDWTTYRCPTAILYCSSCQVPPISVTYPTGSAQRRAERKTKRKMLNFMGIILPPLAYGVKVYHAASDHRSFDRLP